MSRKLDWSKLKFSDKVITTEEALKDVEPFNLDENANIIATKDEVKEYLTLNQIIEKNRNDITLLGSEIQSIEYSEELVEQCKQEFETFVKPIRDEVIPRHINNTYKVADKETTRKAMEDCTKKYNNALKNLADK